MSRNALFAGLKGAIEAQLQSMGMDEPSEVDIRAEVRRLLPVLAPAYRVSVDKQLDEEAIRAMLTCIPVKMRVGAALKERSLPPPWVGQRDLHWPCWNAYETYLHSKRYPGNVIMTLGHDTRNILNLLGNPEEADGWDRRGLVLGHVQSGKTSNYAGLLCRAADAGYKLFIVITGIHENLRSQTQQRLEEGFTNLAPAEMRPISLTTPEYDFSQQKAELQIPPQAVGTSVILVIKKNARVLENLLQWLRNSSKPGGDWADMPLMLVDDEADNASVNTNKEELDPTRINGLIRSILNTFRKSSYVGYTATPFANIFIDPETENEMYSHDLFPSDFIYCLSAPDNYFGADKVFAAYGDDRRKYLNILNDAEEVLPRSARSTFVPIELPASLIEAVETFFLACAIRYCNGEPDKHMSMLVNVSPYAAVQQHVRLLLDDAVQQRKNAICASARMPGQENALWSRLESVFQKHYADCGILWSDIRTILPDVVRSIQLRVINSRSGDSLKYGDYSDTGLHVIAIGGYTLSRGLTLEGLMISYWNRNSKAYDTLMQMGRWFGYRDSYEDLCRVWMPEDAQGWYAHIAEISQELREDLISMSQRGLTPADFGLKVRNHPETLIVTAMNKRRATQERVVRPDLNGRLVETWVVFNEQEKLAKNQQAMRVLLEQVQTVAQTEHPQANTEKSIPGPFLWRAVSSELVEAFFNRFMTHPKMPYDNQYLFAYIFALKDALRRRGTELCWDVGLFSAKQQQEDIRTSFAGLEVWKQRRTIGADSPVDGFLLSTRQRVATKGIECLPLSAEQIATAEDKWRKKGDSKQMADHWYRGELERPLLMLHLIDLQDAADAVICPNVAAWGASFPPYGDLRIQAHEYTVSRNWLRLFEPVEAEPEDE